MPLCKFGKYAYSFDEIVGELAVMVYQHVYSDFDAFVASINGLDFSAMAQSVQRQSWSLSHR